MYRSEGKYGVYIACEDIVVFGAFFKEVVQVANNIFLQTEFCFRQSHQVFSTD